MDVDEYLPIYKMLSVPLYYYPSIDDFNALKRAYIDKFETKKEFKNFVRNKYRCYLSENSVWKLSRKYIDIDYEADLPEAPMPSVVVVMFRKLSPSADDYIKSLNLKVNFFSNANKKLCGGFYSKNFEDVEYAVNKLGENNLIKDAMIVNATWFLRLNQQLNLFKLKDSGIFVPSVKNKKSVNGNIRDAKIIIFSTGTIYILKAVTPAIAYKIARKTYGVLKKYGAI